MSGPPSRFGVGPPSRGHYDGPPSVYLDRVEFFRELATRTEVLEHLRDLALPEIDVEVVREWGKRYHLDVPWVIETAVESLRVWKRFLETGYDPLRREEPLASFTVVAAAVRADDPSAVDELSAVTMPIRHPTAADRPPDPERETREEYLQRAGQAYDEVARLQREGGERRPRRNRTEHDVEGEPSRVFRWLVDYQVDGWTWNGIAAREELGTLDPTTRLWTGRRNVARQVRSLSDRIGLPLR